MSSTQEVGTRMPGGKERGCHWQAEIHTSLISVDAREMPAVQMKRGLTVWQPSWTHVVTLTLYTQNKPREFPQECTWGFHTRR